MYVSQEEAALIEQAVAGNGKAFELLIKPHMYNMRGVIMRVMRDDEYVDDVLQEALIKAFRFLHTFRKDSKLSTWLFQLAQRMALTELKRIKGSREAKLTVSLTALEEDDVHLAELTTPDVTMHDMQVRRDLANVLEAMRDVHPELVETLLLRELSDMTDEEISKQLGCPRGTVRSRVYRAKETLKRMRKQAGEES